jgi:hypothetical protein
MAIALAAGCASLGGRLLNASDDLETSTARFHDEVRDERYSGSGSERDAEDLARAAVDFRRQVERGSARADLDAAFERIARPYHALRDYYDRGGDRVERERFYDVTEAYLDVEGALRYRLSEFSSGRKVR